MKACECIVNGRVQGVGFRFWTMRTAQSLGISGWVRNLPDGSVQLRAQGPEKGIDTFLAALHNGPLLGKVTDVTVTPMDPSETNTEFTIRP